VEESGGYVDWSIAERAHYTCIINVQVTASSKALCIEDTHGANNIIREPPDDGGEDEESDI
jgi:hypothetical protein